MKFHLLTINNNIVDEKSTSNNYEEFKDKPQELIRFVLN